MKSTSILPLGQIRIVILFVVSILVGISLWSASQDESSQEARVRKTIDDMIRKTIAQGRFTTEEGVTGVVRNIPPSPEYLTEVRRLGDDAIPVLASYLREGNGPERLLAVRFLGAIGTRNITAPLVQIVLGKEPETIKLASLLTLAGQAPYSSVAPELRRIAEADVQDTVRDKARELLREACPER